MRNFGDSVDGSRLGQTLSGAVCGGFVQTSSRWRKRNARDGCLRYILDCLKDVLTLVTHSAKDEAGAKLGRVPEEGSEPPADTTAHAEALKLERAGLGENFE